jgi:5-methylcytosine-specific restriction protein B
MNTADRSAALMDVALRRRFEFEYMPPLYNELDFSIDDVHVGRLLEKLNNRIEKLRDRDHTIGHAFFMKLKNSKSPTELRHIFKHKILPLLEEYFYEDWKGLVEIVPSLISENNGIYRWNACLDQDNDIANCIDELKKIANG